MKNLLSIDKDETQDVDVPQSGNVTSVVSMIQ